MAPLFGDVDQIVPRIRDTKEGDDQSILSSGTEKGPPYRPVEEGGSSVVLTVPPIAVIKESKTRGSSRPDESDEVVSLKKCHHSFHFRCLTSWFLTERYDCPVCRSIFWNAGRLQGGRPAGSGSDAVHQSSRDEERGPPSFWEAMVI